MIRRHFLTSALALTLPWQHAKADVPLRTRWTVKTSEGLDALCFLGPLSGDHFYADYYPKEVPEFSADLNNDIRDTIARLFEACRARGGLLGPQLALIFSGGPTNSLADIITSLNTAEAVLRPPYAASPYWDEASWTSFIASRDDLRRVFEAMRVADFSGYRHRCIDTLSAQRLPALRAKLSTCDTIAEQEKLLGKPFADPSIEVVLAYFSQPHGIRVQGQRFLTGIDYPDRIVIRNANHELMHPPFDARGAHMKTVFARLARDPVLSRVVREHDHRFGYNTLEGLIDEDTVQALEQIINEKFAVATDPAKRWREGDGGMHIFAAGLYGLLKAEGYDQRGGNIEHWLYQAAKSGRLAPKSLHAAAARVLKCDEATLWPVPG